MTQNTTHSDELKKEGAQADCSNRNCGNNDEGCDVFKKKLTVFLSVILVLMMLLIGMSYSNSKDFYLRSKYGAVEVYQGNFAPVGKKLAYTLPGAVLPEDEKEVYTKHDVYPLICRYYIDKSDALLAVKGLPDFGGIQTDLDTASDFTITDELEKEVQARYDALNVMVALYKADVAAGSEDISVLKKVKKELKKTKKLKLDPEKKALVAAKYDEIVDRIKMIKRGPAKEKETEPESKKASEKKHAPTHDNETAPETEPKAKAGARSMFP